MHVSNSGALAAPCTCHLTRERINVEGKPKRAPSAYMLFCDERRKATRIANPGASWTEVRKVLAADWKLVDADTKMRLKRQSVAAAAKYRVAMAAGQTVSAHANGRTGIWLRGGRTNTPQDTRVVCKL